MPLSIRLSAPACRRKLNHGTAKKRQLRFFEQLEERAVLAVTWGVQSDYFGERNLASQARSLRGLALSGDEQHVYGGFIQSLGNSAGIREVSSGINASLIGNGSPGNAVSPNPFYNTGLEAYLTTFDQTRAIDTDDRGNVYSLLAGASSRAFAMYSSNLGSLVSAVSLSNPTAGQQINGLATLKVGSNYYAYVGWSNGLIQRFNVTNASSPLLDTTWGNSGSLGLRAWDVDATLNGLAVDTDGTIYVAGGVLTVAQSGSSFGDALIKIPAAVAAAGGISAASPISFAAVRGGANDAPTGAYAAADVALYAGKAYVTQYLQTNSTIRAYYTLDLSFAEKITPPIGTLVGPSGRFSQYNSDAVADSGFSGIDISADGKIYLAEQLYNYQAGGSYTPPGGAAQAVGRLYFDRILVSTALDVQGPVSSSVVAAPNPVLVGAGNLITLTANINDTSASGSTIASAEYSVDGGTVWSPMSAVDGTFNQVSENVTASFTLGAAALNVPGSYTILVRGKDTANQTGATASTTLVVNGTAPTIDSADNATFVVGAFGTFTVTTTATPTAGLTVGSGLPDGVTFFDNGNGTATISGTPAIGEGGVHTFTITASNAIVPNDTQTFTLTVNEAPNISSENNTTFTVGALGTFTITTAHDYPTPAAITYSGDLPAGVALVDNGDGTATLSGTPAVGTGGTHTFTIIASNGVNPNDSQSFTLTVNEAPKISSANNTTFTVGALGTFTITTAHDYPTPAAITYSGALPSGVAILDNGDGTATLSGTPAVGTGGTHTFTIIASNGVNPNDSQSFTLTVNEAPKISSANGTIFTAGALGTFTVTTAHHYPTPAAITYTGDLPDGVALVDNGDGTATLSGTPAVGTGGTHTFTIIANNGVAPNDTQSFTLTVNEAPTFTSANTTTFTVSVLGSFLIETADHFPTPAAITSGSTLPAGVTLVDNGDGTATLSGTPASGTQGSYTLNLTANNGVSPNGTQSFTLVVNPAPIDYGDAPNSYGTLLASDGARHGIDGVKLGTLRDAEADGQPNAAATGDGADEDGVVLPTTLVARLGSKITVTASGSGRLDAWIDFNRNGVFDTNEKIADGVNVVAGANALNVAVPANVVAGASYARFRVSSTGGLAPTGAAANGEVEDYAVTLANPPLGFIGVVDDPENPGNGLLIVRGTNNFYETITVAPTAGQPGKVTASVSPGATLPNIDLTSFNRIVIFGEAGFDQITINSAITKPSVIYGDAGFDTINGGGGNDIIYGGPDYDTLNGNGGDDTFYSDGGTDNVNGGAGTDTVVRVGSGTFNLSNSTASDATGSASLNSVEKALLIGGANADTFNVAGWTGQAQIEGGGGSNIIADSADGNFTLNPNQLIRTVGSTTTTIQFTNIQSARLTGGFGNNNFDLSAWTQQAILDGGYFGTDSVTVAGDVNYLLSDAMLLRGALGLIRLAGFENAVLNGGASSNSFDVINWKNAATVNGLGGTDKLIAAGNVNFTLTNTTLTRSVGGAIALASIEQAELTGGVGNNTINAASFSGQVKLDGDAGNDTLTGGSGIAILLGGAGNDILNAGTGRTVMIGGLGIDTLNGGSNDDLLVDGTTVHDSNSAALALILAEWASAASYSDRVAHLTGTSGGANGSTHLGGSNVTHDTAVDILLGAAGDDLFFAKLTAPNLDTLSDKTGGESAI